VAVQVRLEHQFRQARLLVLAVLAGQTQLLEVQFSTLAVAVVQVTQVRQVDSVGVLSVGKVETIATRILRLAQ
jgi:hypothetical protein